MLFLLKRIGRDAHCFAKLSQYRLSKRMCPCVRQELPPGSGLIGNRIGASGNFIVTRSVSSTPLRMPSVGSIEHRKLNLHSACMQRIKCQRNQINYRQQILLVI